MTPSMLFPIFQPEAGGDAGHGEGDQVVQVTVGRVGQLQGPKIKAMSGRMIVQVTGNKDAQVTVGRDW